MATLATLYDKFFGVRDAAEPVTGGRVFQSGTALYALRPLPNEDILFYVKRFDNSKVVRQANPDTAGTALKVFGGTLAMAGMLVLFLLPSVLGYRAGYKLEALEQERDRLVKERASLEYERAKLLSPARLEALSKAQELVDPEPASVIYLAPQDEGVLALNGGSAKAR